MVNHTLPTDDNGNRIQALKPYSTEKVSYTGTNAQSSTFTDQIYIIRVASTTDCFIAIGTNPDATSGDNLYLPAGSVEYFVVCKDGTDKLGVAQVSSAGDIYITEMI